MSKFSDKIFQGKGVTDLDWTEHLEEAHSLSPGMTPKAFAEWKTTDGMNSYETLFNLASPFIKANAILFDLACGDGFFIQCLLPHIDSSVKVIGSDMSMGELEVARHCIIDPRVTFIREKAQELAAKDESVDIVFCHMAFMLMLPVEPVVQNIFRILKPGGRFFGIVGALESRSVLFQEIQKICFNFLDERYPKIADVQSGDPRVSSKEGLVELFNREPKFEAFELYEVFELKISANPNRAWEIFKDMYFIGMLPDSEKYELRTILINFLRSKMTACGVVNFEFPLRKFVVSKKE